MLIWINGIQYNCKWQARKFSVDCLAITRKRCNRKEDVNHETDLLEKRFYLVFIHNIGTKLTLLLLTFDKTVTEHKYSNSSNLCQRFLSEISYKPRNKLNEKALLKLVIKRYFVDYLSLDIRNIISGDLRLIPR